MHNRYFSDIVVEWYALNKRDLPWRLTQEPYRIWLSEIILQQTRVLQGLPYYLRFTRKFPTVGDLAKASEQDVLRLWQGLGYYTRARNLHKCAHEIVAAHSGKFPTCYEDLKKLPGIGEYTAAAIASFAFSEPVAVVDGNVFRVLARIFGIDTEINTPKGRKEFSSLANTLINKHHPGIHNQAVMEFGALHCTPVNPKCEMCPFFTTCFAAKHNVQGLLPVKSKAKAVRKRYFYYFVIQRGKSLWMKKREHKDIWQGLYDFYLVETKQPKKVKTVMEADAILQQYASNSQQSITISSTYKHILSHQIIKATFIIIKSQKEFLITDNNLKFYTPLRISELPKPVLISRFLEDFELL